MKLLDKHIIVTGASSGIGRCLAIMAAKEGARITAIARRSDELAALLIELKVISTKQHACYTLDLTDDDAIRNFAELTDACDGIVHSAGKVFPLPVKFIKRKHVEDVWGINAISPIILTATLLSKSKIKNFSSLVFISSVSTQHPYFGGALYVSSKAAIEAYSRNLALELASKKIRSNVVSPALVKTTILEKTIEASDVAKLSDYEKNYPFGFGEPEDVASALLFFLSNESKWITGQNLILDGGLTLQS